MINYKSEDELQQVLSEFNIPEPTFTGRKDAGPDEELYFFKDTSGTKYGVWARDYMDELKYEKTGLKNDFDIEVNSWLNLKNSSGQTTELDGDTYAVFTIKN
jgi:hypothetical protein